MNSIANFVAGLYFQNKELIITIGLGLLCGLLAQMIFPGKGHGLIVTIVLGIIACYISKFFIVKYITFIHNPTAKLILAGTLCTIGISVIIDLFRIGQPKAKDKTKWRNNP